jgi:hypothetical protein
MNDRITNRTQQRASDATSAVAAHNNKLGRLRLFDQLSSRSITNNNALHRHIGVAFLPAR